MEKEPVVHIILRKQQFPNTTWQMHVEAHRTCDIMHKICKSSNGTKSSTAEKWTQYPNSGKRWFINHSCWGNQLSTNVH